MKINDKTMLSQLTEVSYVVGNSLARKLAGVDFSVPVEVLKIGYTVKGQPWISYKVNGKKRSQFVSRSLWNSSLKKHSFCMFQINQVDGNVALDFTVTNPENRVHAGTFSKDYCSCSCKGFEYRQSCYHSEIYKLVGGQLLRAFFAGQLRVKDNCFVKVNSVPVSEKVVDAVVKPSDEPELNIKPTTDSMIEEIREPEIDEPELDTELAVDDEPAPVDLATQIWNGDRGKIIKAIDGVDTECVRVSLYEVEIIEAQANKEFKVVEIEYGQVIVKQSDCKPVEKKPMPDPKDYPLPARILAAHNAAKAMIHSQQIQRDVKKVEYPSIDNLTVVDVEWSKNGDGNSWQSNQGTTVEGDFLKEVVRRQLLAGYAVKISTSKGLYNCYIDGDGDVKNTLVSCR